MSKAETIAKLMNVSEVFKAALTLHRAGLSQEDPAEVLRRYIASNPDITEYVSENPYPESSET